MSANFRPDLYTSNPKDVTSLDEDLKTSRTVKYNNLASIVKTWLIQYSSCEDRLTKSQDLIEALKDGVVLCQLVNNIEDKYNNSTNKIKFKESSISFMQMENISFFLNYCVKIGVPQDELFQTIDLYESQDPYQVMLTIQSLSRCLSKKFPGEIEIIGPKLAEKPSIPKKPSHLSQYKPQKPVSSKNPNWSTMEYGYMGGANQKTENIVFGGTRNIIRGNNDNTK